MTRIRLSLLAVVLAAGASPALGGDPAQDLQRAVAAVDVRATIAALQALGEQGDEKAAKMILGVSLKIDELAAGKKKFSPAEENDIFDAAKAALIKVKDDKAKKFLIETLKNDKKWQVREIIVDALARKDDDEAEEALVGAIKDRSPIVAGTAIRALAKRRSAKAVDLVIEVLEKTEKKRDEPWLDAQTFMVELTGNTDLAKAADWKTFWAEQKKTFDPKKVPRRTGGETIMREAPKFLGVEVLSKRCVFILDVSGSMLIKDMPAEGGNRGYRLTPEDDGWAEAPIERTRMFRLQEAMVKCIEQLPEDTKFTIITFSNGTTAWNTELVPANAQVKADAIEFVKQDMDPRGHTWTDTAIEAAFEIPEANTFYLFSDGIPQRGNLPDGGPEFIDKQAILEVTKDLNRLRKVKIFTIGFGEADPQFMAQLAQQNDGKFTAVK